MDYHHHHHHYPSTGAGKGFLLESSETSMINPFWCPCSFPSGLLFTFSPETQSFSLNTGEQQIDWTR